LSALTFSFRICMVSAGLSCARADHAARPATPPQASCPSRSPSAPCPILKTLEMGNGPGVVMGHDLGRVSTAG
jgi:hypothetical protein